MEATAGFPGQSRTEDYARIFRARVSRKPPRPVPNNSTAPGSRHRRHLARATETKRPRGQEQRRPWNVRLHETSKAFVSSLNDPGRDAADIQPTPCRNFVRPRTQPVLVTPANSDRRSAVMVEPLVSAVGAGRSSAPPLPVREGKGEMREGNRREDIRGRLETGS